MDLLLHWSSQFLRKRSHSLSKGKSYSRSHLFHFQRDLDPLSNCFSLPNPHSLSFSSFYSSSLYTGFPMFSSQSKNKKTNDWGGLGDPLLIQVPLLSPSFIRFFLQCSSLALTQCSLRSPVNDIFVPKSTFQSSFCFF